MKILVGLGNPGSQYELTRHNAGFLFVEWVAAHFGAGKSEFKLSKKWSALTYTLTPNSYPLILVKPQTFMNDSGRAVGRILEYYHLEASKDLILAHDDLDVVFGSFKIGYHKNPRIHNGVNSVISHLGNSEFWSVRFGIQGETYNLVKQSGQSVAEGYVLKPFTKEEQEQLPQIFVRVWDELQRKDQDSISEVRENRK